MKYFTRGAPITIRHTFYDSSGEVVSPSSVRLTISYPTSGFPLRGCYTSTYVTMTQLTSDDATDPLGWEGSWNSIDSAPGNVYWTVRSDDLNDDMTDGEFVLRGNPANTLVTSTT